jgi:c-di-GMP-binding flagellar brake protein YcgR
MITIPGESVSFVEAVKEGFRTTTGDTLAFFAILGGFAAVLAGGYLHQRTAEVRKGVRAAKTRLNDVGGGLSRRENRLLRNLVAQMRGEPNKMYSVATDRAVFDQAVERLAKHNAAPLVVSLARKLGLSRVPRRTTRSMRRGTEVRVLSERGLAQRGRVKKVRRDGLVIGLETQCSTLHTDDLVRVHYSTPDARCRFATRVERCRGRSLLIEHRSRIVEKQERRSYRSAVSTPAIVSVIDGPAFRSRVIDLSADGATVLATRHGEQVKMGSRLKLAFGISKGERMSVYAHLVRRSQVGDRSVVGERLHLEFEPMSKRLREKIMRFVLGRPISGRPVSGRPVSGRPLGIAPVPAAPASEHPGITGGRIGA